MAASAKTIAHSYILALDANTPEGTRDAIVETLKSQGAQIDDIINYPDIMQAISFTDGPAASGQTAETAEIRISTWKASLQSYGDSVHSLEQNQVVSIPEQPAAA